MIKDAPKDRTIPAARKNPGKVLSKADLETRDRILAMLSDTEMAKVSTDETGHLDEGEEYIDLEQLGEGVKRADGTNSPIGHVLPKRSVRRDVWTEILKQLPQSSQHARP